MATAVAKPSEEDASGKKKWRRTNSGSSKVNFGIETVFEEVWQHLRHILAPIDGFVAPDDEEDEGVHEEREQSQRKEVFDQLHQVWEAFGKHLLQELSMGKAITLQPIGTVYRPQIAIQRALQAESGKAGVPKAAFHFNPKFLADKGLTSIDAPAKNGDGPGPCTRIKHEIVADLLGWSKPTADQVLQMLMKSIASNLGSMASVSIDIHGVGSLMSSGKEVQFVSALRPLSGKVHAEAANKVATASHTMFGGAGKQLLRRSPSGSALLLPKLEHRFGSVSGADLWGVEATPQKGLAKSSSTPAIPGAYPPGARKPEAPPLSELSPQRLAAGTATSNLRAELISPVGAASTDASERRTRALPAADQLFPPLLDRCSRTRSALFREEVELDLVSNLIASNYSVHAQTLTVDPKASDDCIRWKPSRTSQKSRKANDGSAVDNRAVDWTAEWPQILSESPVTEELAAAGIEAHEMCRVLSRYKYYTTQGVPSEVLAPFNAQWLDHAIFLLELENERRWLGLDAERRKEIVEEVKRDILKGYIRAIKVGMVDYALLNERTRQRLDVGFSPDPFLHWGSKSFTVPDIGTYGGPPSHWIAGISAARATLLTCCVQNSKTALRLKDFWQSECSSQRLLSVPAQHVEPKDINAFHAQQVAQLDSAIKHVTEAWHTVIKIVSEEPMYLTGSEVSCRGLCGVATEEEMEVRFFESVAHLLSLMARDVVEQSLQEYGECFERFAAEPLHYREVKALRDLDPWQDEFLVNKLVLAPGGVGEVRFKQDLDQVLARILNPYKECTVSLREFPRPDMKLGKAGNGRSLIWEVREDEAHIHAGYERIKLTVQTNLLNAQKVLELYTPFLFLLDEEQRVTLFAEDTTKERKDYIDYINHLRQTIDNLTEACPPQIRMQMMRVDGSDMNRKLTQCAMDCIDKLLKILASRNQDRCVRLVKQFEQLNARIMRTPGNEEQLVELESCVDNAQNVELPKLLAEYEDIKEWLYLTWDMDHLLYPEDYKQIHAASEWKAFLSTILNREHDLKDDRAKIEGKLVERRNKFQDELTQLINKVTKFKDYGDKRRVEEYLEKLAEIKRQLAAADVTKEDINKMEEMIGWEATDFEALDEARTQLDPFDKLWNLVDEKEKGEQKWKKTSLFSGEIDPEKVENDSNSMWRVAFKLKATFEQNKFTKSANIAAKIKTDLDQFKEHIPLLHALCNKGLRERHWKEISNIVGFVLEPDPSLTLQKAIDMDIGGYVQEISEISESAGKEYQIEVGLESQIKEWEPIMMEFKPWASTGTFIVAGSSIDEVQTLLDDHIIKTQTMSGSPYAGSFAEKITEWENFLRGVQDIIDVWLKVQSVWLYLEPIFSSPDIMQQMPTEGRLFTEVDATWRELMQGCTEDPPALAVFRQDGFLEHLQAAHEKLEKVQKGLNDYLETKRLFFPRFFFLSNDNLLEILSETKDPKRVNAHIKKAFEGIQSLGFEENLQITSMISPEKESVRLTTLVDPNKAEGAVEKWLVQVEASMIESVRDLCFQARDDYVTKSFVDWLALWPGQVIIAIFSLFWTQEANSALKDKGNAGLKDYGVKLNDVLRDIVNLVRTEIPKLVRCTLEALIVIFVHNKDTIVELFEKGIEKPDDFDWLVQLRYFIEPNPDKPGREDLFVRITNSFLGYAYEYIGNCSRLVVTPLTDRCYRTCCGALHLMYGAAPEGPAGTGKTETVKDLAKALARFCVVFNCSDELDAMAMAKFFKGLAASGGWACFDEFNRIDAEVLSVIAQQILQIQNAIKARLNVFEFEGTTLPIIWTCNCFITMNPGYAGRAELPDNLKALFRTVAMMVPDYAMIAEIKLYAYGYEDSRSLAQKIVITYKLCSEQLSSQKHYDYGMRAVFSVLVAAGNGKRKYPDVNESQLMLQAICDVNLAKFLAFDVPLFRGITSDLFPGVDLPKPDYSALIGKMTELLGVQHCQPHPYFIEKIIQFYECHIVRHSVMLVGMPFSGKTTALNVLQDTLSALAKDGTMHPGCIVHQARLNPKSIPANCLYGSFDEVSHEWTDGIVAVLFREFGRNMTEERKWLVFDGPVDAVWIENMNTVMDENKKLCLNSGEIIAMSPNMRTIMEPMDVEVASPATISRNGMVYFEPHLMGYQHLIEKSFAGDFPSEMDESECEEVKGMTQWIVPPLLKFVNENCQVISPSQDQNLVQSFLKLLMSHLKLPWALNNYKKGAEPPDPIVKKNVTQMLDALVIFSAIWAIGSVLVTSSRPAFMPFFRTLLQGKNDAATPFKKLSPEFPERGSIFDYVWDLDRVAWVQWTETVEPQVIPAGSSVENIIVQTMDNVRYSYLLNHCVNHRLQLLFCGPTGTGKTAYMMQSLMTLHKDHYMQVNIGFSAQTKCAQTQDLIDAKLDRRRKGVYGPPSGKVAVVMVDDLNMPNKEQFGAQPPIEILRQMIDSVAYPAHGGWYDRKDPTHPFRHLTDVMLFAAMGPPGGGRTFITPRMTGHLFMVGFPELDDDNMSRIFSTILEWKMQQDNYPEDVQGLTKKIVQGTLEIYKSAVTELLPTPLKVHYTFNLRDFAKVIFGMLMLKKGECDGVNRHIRLWVHEVTRVFGDRLVDNDDRLWMLQKLRGVCKTVFNVGFDECLKHLDLDGDGKVQTLEEVRNLIFGDLMSQPAAPNRPYAECPDTAELQTTIESYLEQYNLMSSKKMNLVCFLYMLEHLSRVARMIKTPGGNALLVGVGGSGRQSCSKLACFLADFEVFQIEIVGGYDATSFREDLKKLLQSAGGKGEKNVFLFTDTQIKSESFVEDLNNLLNSGEVPNLFAPDERIQVCESVRAAARAEGKAPDGTPAQLYAYFVERCRQMLCVVLCFSPIGDAWRSRLRQFPSLVNCCTIDWFTEWPSDALTAVAQRFLGDIEMDGQVRSSCVEMCSLFHSETRKLGKRFQDELKRVYYATPTSFLELIQTFKQLLSAKRQQVSDLKDKYEKGVEKIVATEESVAGMKIELIDLQPKLVQKNKEVGEMMVVVNAESDKTAKVKEVVAADEAVAAEAAAKSEASKAEVEADLAEAMPALEEALRALDTLTSKDITEIKAMKSPPAPVKLVLQAVCVMKGLKPARVKDDSGKMVEDFWPVSVKMLGDSGFLGSLQTFDKDNIPPPVIKKISSFTPLDDFQPARVKTVSTAAFGICMWVRAMEVYDRVAKDVAPKKESLAIAEAEYAKVMESLNEKRAELQKVLDELAALEAKLNGLKQEQDDLAFQVDQCEKKISRAETLIESLGGEKARWLENSQKLAVDHVNLTGDVLVSSGVIAYLGAFTPEFRESAVKDWGQLSLEKSIPGSSEFTLASCLGEPVKIRNWTIMGLPNDSFSIENGIIIDKARRWPLCIDPQGQSNKWIKKMEAPQKLKVLKFTDGDYLRRLEGSIQYGNPCLIENILEDTDPAIEPVLLKQTYKQGNRLMIKLGDSTLEYHKEFKLYMTTKLRNPHYLPEVAVKVTLLNFMITLVGLQDQLLNIVVQQERPELAEEKARLVVEGAENKAQLEEAENKILYVLQHSSGNILEDESAINVLSSSKALSNKIEAKQKIAEETEVQIDEARQGYVPVAFKTAILFFCIADLANIDPMYQYSLPFFNGLFLTTFEKAEKSNDLDERIENINDTFRYTLYCNICRSLFERHKMLFSFLLLIRLLLATEQCDNEDYRFLLTGGVSLEDPPPKPAEWIPERCWGELFRLSLGPARYENFHLRFAEELDAWKQIYDDTHPVALLRGESTRPKSMQDFNSFQDILVLRCVRPDRVVPAILEFVSSHLGEKFVTPPPFDLAGSYADSTTLSPLIFILSPGADPGSALYKFAHEKNKEVAGISLGQGQGPKAEKMMDQASHSGGWVLLQNCHLATSWMPKLDRILENMDPKKVHRDFRLWLTSYPSNSFPVAILQNGVKMTNEAPKGLRANITGSYSLDPIVNPEFFDGCANDAIFKRLTFNLCFFHAVIQERRLFGPLGWNISYEFTENDLRISARQLQMFLDEYPDEVPFKAINYLTGECNYGGRVTDDKDRRLIMTLLGSYYRPEGVKDDFIIYEEEGVAYRPPPHGNWDTHMEHIASLPLISPPGVFGFHENANLSKENGETYEMMRELLLTVGTASSSSGSTPEEVVAEIAKDVLARVAGPWNIAKVQEKYPTMYEESMNTVLVQDLTRFNGLLKEIHASLKDIQKAVKGLLLMSAQLEVAFLEIFNGRTPGMWLAKSYPSLKPLGSYVNDLAERIRFFQTWVDTTMPVNFWFSGIYFTQAFTTGASQNFARKYRIPIDTLSFDFDYPKDQDPQAAPEDGVYTYGLFFEACRWDWNAWEIAESMPKTLFVPSPLIHLLPVEKGEMRDFPHYECPCYKVSSRKGVLSTTGHSTNFVMYIKVNSSRDQAHWIKRGAALLTQLDT